MTRSDIIAAIATPPGEGGIGVIRISGAGAIELAEQIFVRVSRKPLQSHRVYFGAIVDPQRGETLDRALLIPFCAPHSYTGEDVAELHCHGSPYLLRRVLELACRQGARVAQPGEFTLRAFLNGKLDLAQAEAVADLIRARSDAQLRSALALHGGKLSRQVQQISDALLGIIASVEAHIDFSEEIGELDPQTLAPTIQSLIQELETLLQGARTGRILREGARVAIVGRPNVGKSSLLNALLGEERAIVTDIPGTTRDTIEESFQIEGVPIVILDTAGLRESTDVVEQIGVERARRAAERADLILFVYDLSAPDYEADVRLLRGLPVETPKVVVGNKVDLCSPHPQPLSRDAGEGSSPSPTAWERGLGVRAQPSLFLPSPATAWTRSSRLSCTPYSSSASARRRPRSPTSDTSAPSSKRGNTCITLSNRSTRACRPTSSPSTCAARGSPSAKSQARARTRNW
ncbi:MAG: tRNA uridine-5-carboxymethylaminomethyl(34) synthesis GTPase MnmE [Fimbriimonadales bacterium]|nr:tRNA uridine-5-carboxymethylaminomethyl(34) synthesis GTPase MnmE [Fimbriimonadales bacterium]